MEEMVTINKKDYELMLKKLEILTHEFEEYKEVANKKIDSLTKENALLEQIKKFLEERLRLRKIEAYARKQERLQYQQLSLFDELEGMNEINAVEEEIEETQEIIEEENKVELKKKRVKRKNFINEIDESLFEKEIKHVTIDEPGYRDINHDEVSKTLKVIPCKYIIVEKHIHVYETLKDGERVLVRATDKNPNPLGKESVNVDFLTNVVYQKFVNSVPLYRQEKEFKRMGIPITRTYLSSLITRQISHFDKLFDLLKSYVKSADIARCDETPLKVIKGIKKKDVKTQNGYIRAVSTGKSYEKATYYMVSTRSHDTIGDFYNGKKVDLMCDGYKAYYGFPNITPVACMVHLRRDFAKLYKAEEKFRREGSYNDQILKLFAKIFMMEKQITSKTTDFEQIRIQRNDLLKPLYDKLFALIDDASLHSLPKTSFGLACAHALNYKKYAYNVFLDGRLEIDNNESERKIKDIVIGRKNRLFCFTESGADVTCKLYSLLMTAMQNDIDPQKYLNILFSKFGMVDMTEGEAKDYLPWSKNIKTVCSTN